MRDVEIKPKAKGIKSVSLLITLLVYTRIILALNYLAVPYYLFAGSNMPKYLGSDPADMDAKWPTIYFGIENNQDMTSAALVVESLVLLISVTFGIFVIGQMLAILRNVQNDNAFARDNGDRLRRIGYFGAGAQLSIYGVWLVTAAMEAAQLIDTEGLEMGLSTAPWIGVLIAFSLATIFRHGTDIKEEQDLTV
ncbi:DUF2975 domain-containing protein [Hyphococcus formosus]|uniref:DUF2975 domain-containing protein n=1 Tax=Hyphococcus formosus TaxID=3143534 RepID=UPI00398B6606